MTLDANIATLRRAISHFNRGDLPSYLEVYAPSAQLHGYAGVEPGAAGIRAFYQAFFAAFPGAQITVEDIFGAGDRVACRFVVSGTHDGPFQRPRGHRPRVRPSRHHHPQIRRGPLRGTLEPSGLSGPPSPARRHGRCQLRA